MRLGKVALRMINSAEKAKFPNVETALFPLIYVEMTFGIFSVIFFFWQPRFRPYAYAHPTLLNQ